MNNRFSNFQEKRMVIFGELVRRYWNGNLNNVNDLELLAQETKEKYNLKEQDMTFIMDHIRVAMGQDPSGKQEFEDELSIVKNSKAVGQPVVTKILGACEYCENEDCECTQSCKYEAHVYKRTEGPEIKSDKCLSCGKCSTGCNFGALADKIEFMPVIDILKDKATPVYAAVAPAIAGQFGDDISMGQIRSALKLMGFKDMIEVALFADILTIKEAFEFTRLVKKEEDFFLTSCCCPIWFNMTKKTHPDLFKHMSPSVSPMIASGRILKELYPDAKVVFIAPCIAKKNEAKEPEVIGSIDFVLNFRELKEIFTALDIHLSDLPSDDKDQASFAGRLYARTGGVSFSVKTVVNRLEPTRLIKLIPKKVDGVKDCKKVLDELSNGENIQANFIEGMGCEGGCVGGPRTNIDALKATKAVNDFAEDSLIMTPFDNLNVMKILKQLGIESIEQIVDNEKLIKLLTRE
ncbi:MAG TPA: iron hydrogenase [Clostridiales bacterium]|nr:MAG: iron hydrogenase [Clostridiales bacterium GWD2_32_59]HAN09122.1 iron hydrogenase [Clostridiales bacterium]